IEAEPRLDELEIVGREIADDRRKPRLVLQLEEVKPPQGIIHGKTYACSITITPMIAASATLCQNTKRRILPSCPDCPVDAVATTMLWASIILPMTPPVLFAVTMRTGLNPSCCAVIFCRLPKRTF